MAVSQRPNTGPVYAAIAQWVDRCLRQDDSLFSPGHNVWTGGNLQTLLPLGTIEGADFEAKLHANLADASAEVIQLAAEVLYVHLLMSNDMQESTKRAIVSSVLALGDRPVTVPPDLDAALGNGLANTGIAYKTHRRAQYRAVIEFGAAWKQMTTREQESLLTDPWAFRSFVAALPPVTAYAQANALMHYVHPESFEPIVSNDHKKAIVKAFADRAIDPADLDRSLLEIRASLVAEHGEPFDFYQDSIRAVWQPPTQAGLGESPDVTRRGWIVRGANVAGQNLVPRWIDEGFCSVGWGQIGEIPAGATRAEINQLVANTFPDDSPNQVAAAAGNLHRFLSQMSAGDLVVTVDGANVYLGTITSDPYWLTTDFLGEGRRRDVDWENAEAPTQRQDLPSKAVEALNARHTVSEITPVIDSFLASGAAPDTTSSGPIVAPDEPVRLAPATEALAKSLSLPVAGIQEWIDLLDHKRQVIFYGPPGTGKTYIAEALARHLTAIGGSFKLLQFHPSYAYEDFFEGFRPRQTTSESTGISFELVPGPLRQIAELAAEEPGVPHILIIDEINRANLAKVFGELYFLLEYRDHDVSLQYSPERQFTLPKNLFLIGTMNTADRSIALVDAAMRRRFYVIEFSPVTPPVDGMLRRHLANAGRSTHLADVLDELNRRIDDKDLAVGPSYLMGADVENDGGLDRVWRYAILPLLEEHFTGSGRDVAKEFGLSAIEAALAGQNPDDNEDLAAPPDEE